MDTSVIACLHGPVSLDTCNNHLYQFLPPFHGGGGGVRERENVDTDNNIYRYTCNSLNSLTDFFLDT